MLLVHPYTGYLCRYKAVYMHLDVFAQSFFCLSILAGQARQACFLLVFISCTIP